MSECIKTGADVFLVDYGAVMHCDLFELESGDYLIHHCGHEMLNYDPAAQEDAELDMIVSDIDLDLRSAKVMIVLADEVVLTKRLKDYLGD